MAICPVDGVSQLPFVHDAYLCTLPIIPVLLVVDRCNRRINRVWYTEHVASSEPRTLQPPEHTTMLLWPWLTTRSPFKLYGNHKQPSLGSWGQNMRHFLNAATTPERRTTPPGGRWLRLITTSMSLRYQHISRDTRHHPAHTRRRRSAPIQ